MVGTRAITPILVGMVLVTSGCMGILDSGTTTAEADPVSSRAVDLDQAGYEQTSSQTLNDNRTVRAGGQDRDVSLTDYLRTFERTASTETGQSIARLTLYSTPIVELGGETVNPVGDWSDERLVNHVSQRYESVELDRLDERRNANILLENAEVRRFIAQGTIDGERTDVAVHLARVQYEGNAVVMVAIHPRSTTGEEDRIDTILSGLTLS